MWFVSMFPCTRAQVSVSMCVAKKEHPLHLPAPCMHTSLPAPCIQGSMRGKYVARQSAPTGNLRSPNFYMVRAAFLLLNIYDVTREAACWKGTERLCEGVALCQCVVVAFGSFGLPT